ncbi:MAG TPA: PAS domain S-box protein, partial [Pseudomonadales bacterium]|nr:PAS domain S-box protein [Pseudomonadales bacterium]
LFNIVEHLAGAEASEAALSEAALFNFLAGQAAMKALAHQESFHYFNQSGALTTAADWKRDYHFMRDLHAHWARAALILAEHGKAQFIISNALQHAKDNADRAQFLFEQIAVSNSLSQQEASIQLGRECCRLLEVPLPETAGNMQAESATLLVELAQSNVISRLDALPEVKDPKTLLTLNLYAELLAPAYFSGQHALYFLLSCRAIALGLHKGQNHFLCTPLGTLSYYFYSQNQPILARQYENKMLAMAKANPDDTTSIMALGQGLWLTLHQTHSIGELEVLCQKNIAHGIRSGELNYTALTHVAWLWYQLIQGRDFARFSQAINDCIVFCERYQLGLPLAISESMLYVLALVNSDANAQAEIQQKLQEWEDKKYFQALATFYCYQGIFLNFTENYAEAEVRLQQAEPYLFSISGTVFGRLWVVHRYLCGLRTANNPQQAEHLQQVSDWATTSDILKPFLALMQAETSALAKDGFDTVRSAYLNAIDSAHSQEYCFLEAYLHHQFGKWLEQQSHHSANMHLFQALQLYKKCHADYFADLLEPRFAAAPLLLHVNTNGATTSPQETLDSAFLLQVTQDIMQERDFNALIKKVLARVMERVGAKTGYLLTLESGQLKVRVLGKKSTILETELVNQDVHTAEFLCIEIARYTLRSGTALVLDNAAEQGDFTHSQAVRRYQLKSVLSIPLINQGRTLGLIYLENSLIPGVFDLQQVKLVNVLTSQAAIALDNSLLISDLRNTQNVLSEREQNLAITLNSIGDGVIVCDAAGCVTLLNPMAQRLTGWSFDEAKGKPVRSIFSIIDSNTKEPILNPVDKVLATGETVYLSNHTTLLARNGEQYHIADSAAPIRDAHRNVIGMVLVFNDVTEAYRLRKEIAESHQKLSEVMSDIHTMVATLTPDGAITFMNKKPLALAGMHSSSVINQKLWKTFWFNYDRDIQDRVQQACENAAQGQHVYCDLRMQSLDGPIWIDFALHPVKNELGHITLLVWEARDITSRKLAEEHLNEQKTAQTLILNNLADAVITTDQLGLVQSFNAAAEKIFGYSSDELIGQPITLLMTSPDATHHDRYVGNYINTGKSKIIGVGRELTAQRKTGEVFPIHLTIAELPPTQDGGKRFVASIQDLSQRKQQQEILQRSQKMEALGKLTGGIAHDYNNMLGVILGYCDLLEPALKHQEKELGFLKQIRHAGERGATLTQKMLSYSRKKTVDLGLVHLNRVLLSQKELLEKTLTVRVQLILQLNATEDKIFINQSDLEDCILNLCINAMHAISDTGRLILSTENIELDARQSGILNISEGPYIVLTVEDNGIGMSEEILSKIFDPFFSTKGEKGTGLGLSQVYSFVERSKGAIKVSSSLGKGSVFSLYFPINEHPNKQLAADQNNASEHTVKGTESILLVDDEPALLELTKEVLKQQGYQVLCASSGDEAIEILQTEQVNLVLSDVIMPGMNGYQLARWIQQHCPHTHIQLISGFDDENATSAVDKLLNAQRLEKPVKASQLLSRIRKLLDTPIE